MEIEKAIKGVQDALSQHEELRGAWVEMNVKMEGMPDMQFGFRVPEEGADEGTRARQLHIGAMQILHDQMGLLQDKAIEHGMELGEIAEVSEAMNGMARTMRMLGETIEEQTRRRLRAMKDAEERNAERIREWSEEYEAF